MSRQSFIILPFPPKSYFISCIIYPLVLFHYRYRKRNFSTLKRKTVKQNNFNWEWHFQIKERFSLYSVQQNFQCITYSIFDKVNSLIRLLRPTYISTINTTKSFGSRLLSTGSIWRSRFQFLKLLYFFIRSDSQIFCFNN